MLQGCVFAFCASPPPPHLLNELVFLEVFPRERGEGTVLTSSLPYYPLEKDNTTALPTPPSDCPMSTTC